MASSGTVLAGFHTTVLPYTSAGRDLPRRDRDGKVERRDDADDADRLAGHQDLLAAPRRGEDLAGLAVALVAVVAQDLRRAAHLADAFGLGLAFLGGQLQPPVLGVAVHHTAAAASSTAPRWWIGVRGPRRPRRRRRPRRPRRHLRCPAVPAFGDHLARPGGIEAAHERRRCRRTTGRRRGAGRDGMLLSGAWYRVISGTPPGR